MFWLVLFLYCAADLVFFLKTSFVLAFGFITFAFIGGGGLTSTLITQESAALLCQVVVSFNLWDFLGVFIEVFFGVLFGVFLACSTSISIIIEGVCVLAPSFSMFTLFNDVNFEDGSFTKSVTYSISKH